MRSSHRRHLAPKGGWLGHDGLTLRRVSSQPWLRPLPLNPAFLGLHSLKKYYA